MVRAVGGVGGAFGGAAAVAADVAASDRSAGETGVGVARVGAVGKVRRRLVAGAGSGQNPLGVAASLAAWGISVGLLFLGCVAAAVGLAGSGRGCSETVVGAGRFAVAVASAGAEWVDRVRRGSAVVAVVGTRPARACGAGLGRGCAEAARYAAYDGCVRGWRVDRLKSPTGSGSAYPLE